MKNTDTRIDWYNGEYGDEHLGKKATIELWGNNIVARSQSGCIVTVPQSEVTVAELKVHVVVVYMYIQYNMCTCTCMIFTYYYVCDVF